MKKTFKTIRIGKKLIPVTAAAGILFSMAPVAEYKPQAASAAVVDIAITSLELLATILDKVGISIGEGSLAGDTSYYAESYSYTTPKFESGAFYISMFHTQAQWGFSRQIKIYYPDGKNEYYQIRSGEQLKITEAGTMVDLNPSSFSSTFDDILYITQQQLADGNTGVALNESNAIYVKPTSGQNRRIVHDIYLKKYGARSLDGFKGLGEDLTATFTPEEKALVQLKSTPVGREALTQYMTNTPQAKADFDARKLHIVTDSDKLFETPISNESTGNSLNHGQPLQIIPLYPGSTKVLIKSGSQFLSGKIGSGADRTKLQYTNTFSEENILELVRNSENSRNGKLQFRLQSKDGAYLTSSVYGQQYFSTNTSELGVDWQFTAKTNEGLTEWLNSWAYPLSNSIRDARFNENNIKNGTYHIVAGVNNTSVVDMSTSRERNVHLHGNHGGGNQKWIFEYDDKQGAYQIKSSADQNLVLAWLNHDGSNNVFATLNQNKPEHYWIPEDAGDGYFYLKNKKNPDLVLDVQGGNTSNGTNFIVYKKNNSWNQSFKLKKFKDEYVSATNYSEAHYEDEHNATAIDLNATYRIASALDNSKVLDTELQSGNTRLWSLDSNHYQHWKLEYNLEQKAYQIKDLYRPNLVLAWLDHGGSRNVFRHPNENKPEHYWIPEDAGDGYFYLKNKKNPNLVLDVQGGNTLNGTNLVVYEKNNGSNQKFKLKRELSRKGFIQEGKDTYYLRGNGIKHTGFLQLGEGQYYFNIDGKMQTGFSNIGEDRYYFNTDGKMQTGFSNIGGDQYYFNTDGKLKTGWYELGRAWFYSQEDGKLKTGWLQLGEDRYYLQKTGKMSTGKVTIDGTEYDFGKNGKLKTS
ncbi:RICIN domain-containing protein [Bacillus mycoides]|uniref:RICIN domain-containing protein n=1 Tax=Bacillus mycoides TaxID=1405 RepID=UPI00273B4F3F|nr:RICIN domain-containing protein [Bacillus mycoides]